MGRHYVKVRDKKSGRRKRLHRVLAERSLGRPLLPGEIVHHRDGNRNNNTPENLLVLPSQAYHAHIEYHLRLHAKGQPALFPELFSAAQERHEGTLWDNILPE